MLTTDLKLIISPVIIAVNGIEKEYSSGAAASSDIKPDSRLMIHSLCVRDGRIVVELGKQGSDTAPFNFVGETAVE